MAVIQVKELMPSGSATRESQAFGSGATYLEVMKVSRRFWVRCDSPTDGDVTALTAPLLPQYRDPHPKDSTLKALRFSGEATGSPSNFIITVEYERTGAPGKLPTPIDDPPELRVRPITTELQQYWDINWKPYANTAGEFFDEPFTIPWTDVGIDYAFNSSTFNYGYIFSHVNKVNSNTIAVFGNAPPGTVLLKCLAGEMRFRGDVLYYRISAEAWIRNYLDKDGVQKGWKELRVNTGFLKLNQSGKQVQITDENQLPVRTPAMLSADGKSVIANPTPSTAIYIEFDRYKMQDMTPIGLI